MKKITVLAVFSLSKTGLWFTLQAFRAVMLQRGYWNGYQNWHLSAAGHLFFMNAHTDHKYSYIVSESFITTHDKNEASREMTDLTLLTLKIRATITWYDTRNSCSSVCFSFTWSVTNFNFLSCLGSLRFVRTKLFFVYQKLCKWF